MKKTITFLLSLTLVICLVPTAAIADDKSQANSSDVVENQIYVDTEEYEAQQAQNPMRSRTRGTCYENYSKKWCDAHGIGNRPVPHKVRLNAKELGCLKKWFGDIALAVAGGYVKESIPGVYIGAAGSVYRYYLCIP